jgi:hypothetical protein
VILRPELTFTKTSSSLEATLCFRVWGRDWPRKLKLKHPNLLRFKLLPVKIEDMGPGEAAHSLHLYLFSLISGLLNKIMKSMGIA